MKKQTKREAADAAYMKTETLRGQIDAFDGVQGAVIDREVLVDHGQSAPPICGHCQAKMNDRAGGGWTHLKVWREGETRLQCNFCGGIVVVTQQVWEEVRHTAMQAFVDRSPNKAIYEKRKKMLEGQPTRGAE